MRYGMVIDTHKCMGCNACTIICKQSNATAPGIFWNRVYTQEVGKYPSSRLVFLPSLCMHCENPACVKACPTGATYQLDNGIVVIDQDKCSGCRMCMVACPYNARYFNYGEPGSYYEDSEASPYETYRFTEHIQGTVEKCNLCVDLVASGKDPMCVSVCPAKARVFGDLDDPDSEISKLVASQGAYQMHPELGTNPSVYYLPA
jgi:Fe-S-cluster-containing dehydrogenase component